MRLILASVLIMGSIYSLWAQYSQVSDSTISTKVREPRLTKKKPVILFDEGHDNFHTSGDRYKPFAELIANDGCIIRPDTGLIEINKLRQASILIIANARGKNDLGSDDAFSNEEIDVLVTWVKSGGSLLLIADHYPYGSAVKNLSLRFGVKMGEGGVMDSVYNHPKTKKDATRLLFSRSNELLNSEHPITTGVDTVITFFGQSLAVDNSSSVLLKLSPFAMDLKATGKAEKIGANIRRSVSYGSPTSANGLAQAVAFEYGKGRVVILGEAAMLSAQLSNGVPVGMNVPGSSNKEFALNIIRWLAKVI